LQTFKLCWYFKFKGGEKCFFLDGTNTDVGSCKKFLSNNKRCLEMFEKLGINIEKDVKFAKLFKTNSYTFVYFNFIKQEQIVSVAFVNEGFRNLTKIKRIFVDYSILFKSAKMYMCSFPFYDEALSYINLMSDISKIS